MDDFLLLRLDRIRDYASVTCFYVSANKGFKLSLRFDIASIGRVLLIYFRPIEVIIAML